MSTSCSPPPLSLTLSLCFPISIPAVNTCAAVCSLNFVLHSGPLSQPGRTCSSGLCWHVKAPLLSVSLLNSGQSHLSPIQSTTFRTKDNTHRVCFGGNLLMVLPSCSCADVFSVGFSCYFANVIGYDYKVTLL